MVNAPQLLVAMLSPKATMWLPGLPTAPPRQSRQPTFQNMDSHFVRALGSRAMRSHASWANAHGTVSELASG